MRATTNIIRIASIGIASVEHNDIYMSIKARMLSDRVNLNGMRVTAAFIDDMIKNQQKYLGTAFVVDRTMLEVGMYRSLTHKQDPDTGELKTQMVGSIIGFSKEIVDGETILVGEVRVMKRFPKVCQAIMELYDRGELRFSFEVDAQETSEENGVELIDKSPRNSFWGLCIVSNPAYPGAQPTMLVAEVGAGNSFDEVKNVPKEKTKAVAEAEAVDTAGLRETTVETTFVQTERVNVVEITPDEPAANCAVADDADDKKERDVEEAARKRCGEAPAEDPPATDPPAGDGTGTDPETPTDPAGESESGGESEPETTTVVYLPPDNTDNSNAPLDKKKVAEYAKEIARLAEIEKKYNAIVAEEERKRRETEVSNLRKVASLLGVDTAETKEAIDGLDYKAVVVAALNNEKDSHKEAKAAVTTAQNGFVCDGIPVAGGAYAGKSYGYLLKTN